MKLNKKLLSVMLTVTMIVTSVFSFAELINATPEEAANQISVDDWESMVNEMVAEEETTEETSQESSNGTDIVLEDTMVIGEGQSGQASNDRPAPSVTVNFPTTSTSNYNQNSNSYYPSSLFGESIQDIILVPEVEMSEPRKTIQFTLDKTSRFPVYVDTGIIVESKESLISKEEALDFVGHLNIAVGTATADEVRELTVRIEEAKSLYVKSDAITIEAFEKPFKQTIVNVKVQNSRVGGKYNLSEYLEFKQTATIQVDGKVLALTIEPLISNSVVLLPIKDIALALGAEVKWDKDSREATITKDDKTLIYKPDVDYVNENTEITLSAIPQVDSSRLLVPIQYLVQELGASVHWDAQKAMLIIDTN